MSVSLKKPMFNFDGNVSSRTLHFADSSKKTLGFMLPGEYTFNTSDPEVMEIIEGELEVMLPDARKWQAIKGGESFKAPGNAEFTVRIKSPTDYCRSFIK